MEAELFHADRRRTDTHDETNIAFCNFTNALEVHKTLLWTTESVFVLSPRSNMLTYSVRPIEEGTLKLCHIVKDKTFITAIYNLSTIYAGAAEIV